MMKPLTSTLLPALLGVTLLSTTPVLACDQHRQHTPMTAHQCASFGTRMRQAAQMRDMGMQSRITANALREDLSCPDDRANMTAFVEMVYGADFIEEDALTIGFIFERACNLIADDQRTAHKPQAPARKQRRAPMPRAKTRS